MAYRLKIIHYQKKDRHILLQNENGPCPLLAAANALLLRGDIDLPSHSIRAGVATIDDVVNILADFALLRNASKTEDHHHLDELLSVFPTLQFGMDVNPKFNGGPTGVEYTSNLNAYDCLHVTLVHGWLVDPQEDDICLLIGNKTYNELVELVIQGNEASSQLESLTREISNTAVELERAHITKKQLDAGIDVSSTTIAAIAVTADTGATNATATTTAEDGWVEVSPETTTTASPTETETPTTPQVDSANEATRTQVEPSPAAITEPEVTVATEEPEVTAATAEPEVTAATTEPETTAASTEPEITIPSTIAVPTTVPQIDDQIKELSDRLDELRRKERDLTLLSFKSMQLDHFLTSTSHQLTHYGLLELYAKVAEDELCVFFRNNHFSTMTKHDGVLYLLVTDLGYANVPNVVWEKLDAIDGDTEYVSAYFTVPAPQPELLPSGVGLSPEQLLAQSGQTEADYQLALRLSKDPNATANRNLDEEEGRLMAAATEASLRDYNGIVDGDSGKTPPILSGTPVVGISKSISVGDVVEPSAPPDSEESLESLPVTSGEGNSSTVVPSDSAAAVPPTTTTSSSQEDLDQELARKLQAEWENEEAARRLQQEEQQNLVRRQQQQTQPPQQRPSRPIAAGTPTRTAGNSGCVIS